MKTKLMNIFNIPHLSSGTGKNSSHNFVESGKYLLIAVINESLPWRTKFTTIWQYLLGSIPSINRPIFFEIPFSLNTAIICE